MMGALEKMRDALFAPESGPTSWSGVLGEFLLAAAFLAVMIVVPLALSVMTGGAPL